MRRMHKDNNLTKLLKDNINFLGQIDKTIKIELKTKN